jgi:hypothetical protein
MNIVEELKEKLENANAKTIGELQQNEDPIYWFLLLAKYPEFAPNDAWFFNLRNRCDLPWSTLLTSQEKFVKYCHFASLSRLELLLLALKTPKIYEEKFPDTTPWNLYSFLTPTEKVHLLIEMPSVESKVNWSKLANELTIADWFSLLSYQPQLEKYFDWSKIEQQPSNYWELLLIKQPQFAIHCNWEMLTSLQKYKIKKHQACIFEKK